MCAQRLVRAPRTWSKMTESGRRPSCAARPVASLLPALPVAFFVLLPGTGGKREHFVVPDSGRDVPITGTPVSESVGKLRCIDDRAAGRGRPDGFSCTLV